jgi:hypothetical protein
VPEHLKVVGPKLSLKVVSAKLSLSQNFARHSKFRVCARKLRRLPIIVLELLRAAGKGEWMPKVSNQVQRRIAELDAKYTVAQPKRAGRRVVALIILAHCRRGILLRPSHFVRLCPAHPETRSCACHVGNSLHQIQRASSGCLPRHRAVRWSSYQSELLKAKRSRARGN